MNEGQIGVLILVVAAVVISIPMHLRLRGFEKATIVSGVAASLLLQVLDTVRRGYPDKLALVALVFGAFWGTVVSAAVGLLVRRLRFQSGKPGQGH